LIMKVTKDDLANVALLSRLRVNEADEQTYLTELDKFLTYVDKLGDLDTTNVKPTTYALPCENVFREDEVKESLSRELALSNAPAEDDGYFKVPRVLES